jgi:alkaline phosphatase D
MLSPPGFTPRLAVALLLAVPSAGAAEMGLGDTLTFAWRDIMTDQDYRKGAAKIEKDFVARFPDDPEVHYCLALAYGAQGDADKAMPHLVRAVDGGIPFGRALADARSLLKGIADDARFKALAAKHDARLVGGPMLGAVTAEGARVWVRTPTELPVAVVIGTGETLASPVRSETVRTRADADLTAVVDVRGLKAATAYTYDLLVDGRSALGRPLPTFRTPSAAGGHGRLRIGFGGGARYVPDHEGIWNAIADRAPDAFLFLGDNVYIDRPERPDIQRFHYYRRQAHPAFRRFVASTAIYAIYDDHDFGDNDVKGGPDPFKPAWKPEALRVFRENWVNPYYGGGEKAPGCWHDASIGDVDVFMTDGRYYAQPGKTMLGAAQKRWLLDRLAASKATFKVLASGTLWTEQADKGGKDSWEGYREEREEIFSFLREKKIEGVLLVSADRHRTEVWKIERPGLYPLHEFESSKLTNVHTHPVRKEALFSYNQGNFFGLLSFDTTKTDPEVTFEAVTAEGKAVYALTLKRSQLAIGP